MSGEDVARLLKAAGFTGQDLINFVGIAGRESHWDPSVRRTDNKKGVAGGTGDFGLLQINYGNFGALRQAGIMQNPDDLLDPATNAKAAYFLFKSGGYDPWKAKKGVGFSKDGDPFYRVDLPAAAKAVSNIQSSTGDPMPSRPSNTPQAAGGSGGGSVTVRGGHTFNITIPVTVTNGSAPDIQVLAKNIARVVQRELDVAELRKS
jgi:hypothetical protein